MTKLLLAAAVLLPGLAYAQAAQPQQGIGPTGTMFNGNNTARSAIGPRPDPNRPPPSLGSSSPAAQGAKDESGSGAGGGEH